MPIGSNGPDYTELDQNQIVQRVFDEAEDRLRVDAQVTATVSGPFDVAITAATDNIAIRNTSNNNELLINPDGSINTQISGEVNIEVNAADGDNVAISDGLDTLAINSDGSINVITSFSPTLVEKNYFDSISSVSSGIETIILTYTVPVGYKAYIHYVEAGGTNVAQYTIYRNGNPMAKKWSIYTQLNVDCNFSSPTTKGIEFLSGEVITISVLHNRTSLGDFSARLQMTEEN